MRNTEPCGNLNFCLMEEAEIGFPVGDGTWRKGEGEAGLMFGLNGTFQPDSAIMHVFLLGLKKKGRKI